MPSIDPRHSYRIAVAADHGGVAYKDRIAAELRRAGHDVVDFGTHGTSAADYPDVARAAAHAVACGDAQTAILVCGSGIGISIAANKVRGIRAANCLTTTMAVLAREHNHANVLTIGERLVDWETAWSIVEAFLRTPPSTEERHRRRVAKIHEPEGD